MTIQTSKSKTTLKLLGVVLGMFVFGFALVPLYDIYCQVTALMVRRVVPTLLLKLLKSTKSGK
jgi:cytochrome c oxidase assembly protein Cox11